MSNRRVKRLAVCEGKKGQHTYKARPKAAVNVWGSFAFLAAQLNGSSSLRNDDHCFKRRPAPLPTVWG